MGILSVSLTWLKFGWVPTRSESNHRGRELGSPTPPPEPVCSSSVGGVEVTGPLVIAPISDKDAELPDMPAGGYALGLRGVLLGTTVGVILAFTNMYFGLQTGWISMMSLQSSLMGFGLGRMFAWLGGGAARDAVPGAHGRTYPWYGLTIPFGVKENVFIQTCAVATAAMPLAGGFVGVIPALGLLTKGDRPDHASEPGIVLTTRQLIGWGLGVAFFGVFFAVPLRHQVIVKERLRFPSGTATAQMIRLLHRSHAGGERLDETVSEDGLGDGSAEELTRQWWALSVTFGVSGLAALFNNVYPSYAVWPIFNWIHPEASKWEWFLSPALSYVGQGIIMGLPTSLAMLLGAVVGWGVLAPLSARMGWAAGAVDDARHGPRGWILWTSLAVMVADSGVSLTMMLYRELSARFYARLGQSAAPEDGAVIPRWALVAGLGASAVAAILSVRGLFPEVPVAATFVSVLVGCVLSVLAVRALGETDLNPVSGIGKVSQLLFGVLLPGNLVGNLVAGGVAEAGAMQAGEMMQDLKAGHLLNAKPRAQFYGQLLGSTVSVFASAVAYRLYTSVYTIPGPEFPAPTAQVWLDMARLVNGHPLPPFAGLTAGLFAAVFGLVQVAKQLRPRCPGTRRLPSGIAFAVGIYNPPNFTLTRVLGALAGEAYLRGWWRPSGGLAYDALASEPGTAQPHSFHRVLVTVVASGLVLGEGTVAIDNKGVAGEPRRRIPSPRRLIFRRLNVRVRKLCGGGFTALG
ncbi:OPT super [Massospora cicadina]|nr:OPT super [Massospora cicadina]